MSLKEQVTAFERNLIIEAITANAGNVARTAKELEIPERTLWRKIERYRIDLQESRDREGRKASLAQVTAIYESFRETGKNGYQFDLEELADRLFYGGWKPSLPQTAAAISKAFLTGSMEHL